MATRFALPPTETSRWRAAFSSFEGWESTKEIGPKTRNLLSKLDPPFVPENERIVFFADIWDKRGGTPELRLNELVYQGKSVKDGWIFATESRLIWVDAKLTPAVQVPYQLLASQYVSNDIWKLVLSDGSEIIMRMRFPGPSAGGQLLAVAAILGAPPAAKGHIASMERDKAETAAELRRQFTSTLSGFFNEIIDANHARLRS
jgi:hypothetical protein